MKKRFFNILVLFLLFILLLNTAFAIDIPFTFSLKGIAEGIRKVVEPIHILLEEPAVMMAVMLGTFYFIFYYILSLGLAKVSFFSGSGGAGVGTYGKMIAHAFSGILIVSMVFFSPVKNISGFLENKMGSGGFIFGIVLTLFIFFMVWKSSNHNTKRSMIGAGLASFFLSIVLNIPTMTLFGMLLSIIGLILTLNDLIGTPARGAYRTASRSQKHLSDELNKEHHEAETANYEDAQADQLEMHDIESDNTQSRIVENEDGFMQDLLHDADEREDALNHISENPEMMANMIAQKRNMGAEQAAELKEIFNQMDNSHRRELMKEIERMDPGIFEPIVKEMSSMPRDNTPSFVDALSDISPGDTSRLMKERSLLSSEDRNLLDRKLADLHPRERMETIRKLGSFNSRAIPEIIRSEEPIDRAVNRFIGGPAGI